MEDGKLLNNKEKEIAEKCEKIIKRIE